MRCFILMVLALVSWRAQAQMSALKYYDTHYEDESQLALEVNIPGTLQFKNGVNSSFVIKKLKLISSLQSMVYLAPFYANYPLKVLAITDRDIPENVHNEFKNQFYFFSSQLFSKRMQRQDSVELHGIVQNYLMEIINKKYLQYQLKLNDKSELRDRMDIFILTKIALYKKDLSSEYPEYFFKNNN